MLSVIICAHNPRRAFLERVLQALQEQTLPREQWEFVLVDNASQTPLREQYDLAWHPRGRIVREEALGLTMARLCGIRETTGEVLVFVDDDNLLDRNYLAEVLRLAGEWPPLGVWGGRIEPEWESPPAEWTRPYWPYLALNFLDRPKWGNVTGSLEAAPCGAGLVLRRAVAEAYATGVRTNEKRQKLGRRGDMLTSGEDTDIVLTATDLGYGFGVFPSLKLTHIIPAGRVAEDYLVRLYKGVQYSLFIVKAMRGLHLPPLPSRGQRLLNAYARRRMSPRERRFHDAYVEARRLAGEDIARW